MVDPSTLSRTGIWVSTFIMQRVAYFKALGHARKLPCALGVWWSAPPVEPTWTTPQLGSTITGTTGTHSGV